jgi:thioredoxin-dependent peroxiredoxin
MRKLVLCCLASAIVTPAWAALKEGDKAPEFKAQASVAGKATTFSLKDALGKGPVVVYFYPSAYTGGCNAQAHAFAASSPQFAAASATVVGVSLDSIKRLNAFSADPEYCGGKFPVVSDADGSIAKSFDVKVREGAPGHKDTRGEEIDHGFAERVTFVVKADGTIVSVVGGVTPEVNVEKSLEAVKSLATGGGK